MSAIKIWSKLIVKLKTSRGLTSASMWFNCYIQHFNQRKQLLRRLEVITKNLSRYKSLLSRVLVTMLALYSDSIVNCSYNVYDKRAEQISELNAKAWQRVYQSTRNEERLMLAVKAIQNDPALHIRAAAKACSVPHTTLTMRLRGTSSRRDSTPKSRKLTDAEEGAILQHVLDLHARSFPPRLANVEDMANKLLADRDSPPVGKRWASNFVKRQPQLRTRFVRRHDHHRANAKIQNLSVVGSRLYRIPLPSTAFKTWISTTSTKLALWWASSRRAWSSQAQINARTQDWSSLEIENGSQWFKVSTRKAGRFRPSSSLPLSITSWRGTKIVLCQKTGWFAWQIKDGQRTRQP